MYSLHSLEERAQRCGFASAHRPSEKEHAEGAEHESHGHENKAELGFTVLHISYHDACHSSGCLNLLDTVIFLRNPLDDGVTEPPDKDTADHASEERPKADQANLGRAEKVRWLRKDSSKDDGRANVPAVQDSRGKDGVARCRVRERHERTNEELEDAVVGVDSGPDREGLHECLLWWNGAVRCHTCFAMLDLDFGQFVESLLLGFIRVVPSIANICCLRDEEEH